MVDITPETLTRSGTEDGEQAALFCYALDPRQPAQNGPHADLWSLLYAIPNGGKRSAATAARMRATGTRKGFPDTCLPVARGGYHGLYVELKRLASPDRLGGRLSKDQRIWAVRLEAEGYCVAVCYGWREAVATIEKYLGNRLTNFS